MKILVVFYSFEGNTRFIAETITRAVGADLLELKPKQEIKTHSFMKFFWGGKQVIMGAKPELIPLDKNPQDYDILFIGTPVWSFSFSPSLNTFFSNVRIKNKKVAVFCCHSGGKKRTLEKMKMHLVGNEIIGDGDFLDPLSHDREANARKAEEWARELVSRVIRQTSEQEGGEIDDTG